MSEPFLGQIEFFAFGRAPKGWAPCNGQLLQIAQNQALFSLLSTAFGGDGQSTFGVPNIQGRVVLGTGNGFARGQPHENRRPYIVLNAGIALVGVYPTRQ